MAVTSNNYLVASGAIAAPDTLTALAAIDAGPWKSVCYTLRAQTKDIRWTVFGANEIDYSDESTAQNEAVVATGAVGTYSTFPAVFRCYRVKVKNSTGGQSGSALVAGIAK